MLDIQYVPIQLWTFKSQSEYLISYGKTLPMRIFSFA